MMRNSANRIHRPASLSIASRMAVLLFLVPLFLMAQEPTSKAPPLTTSDAKRYASPEQAADSLINAAAAFDAPALKEIFGAGAEGIVGSGEYPQDRQRAAEFVAEARKKKTVAIDPKNPNRASLTVGERDWPFPVPIVKQGNEWFFDVAAGRDELLKRRIGANELDAIQLSRGYVEAQHEYALEKRAAYEPNQYAQRIISTPGKQDGLAWQKPDGSWEGPVGENVARAIEQGYTSRAQPYHGYFFKILKGQGPAAPHGQLDFVVHGVMIGGFALAAAPAEYGVTGVKTFIVSHSGIVYEKDLGPMSLEAFRKMERFNPDKSWTPVP